MVDNKLVKPGTNDLTAFLGQEIGLTERPDFIPAGDKTGTEGITADDIRLPRLGIAQLPSPELIPGDSKHIDGLRAFQMFNDFTKNVYGNGPIYFIPVRRDKRCIQFRPLEEGGGVVDMDVPWNDDRATKWTDGPNGKRIPPVATRFNEWVILVVLEGGRTESVVLSIKNTNKYNVRAASDLNGYILFHASQEEKSVPIYGVIYSSATESEKNDNGTFGVPLIKQVGYVPKSEIGQKLFSKAQDYAKSLQGKTIVIEREPGDEDFIDADPPAGTNSSGAPAM